MRRTKEDAEITRLALIKAALRVFSEKGYGGTRLEDIAAVAGVTRGAIYHHFGGKFELYLAVFDEFWRRADPIFEEEMGREGRYLDKFRRMFIRYLELVERDPEFQAMMELSFQRPEVPENERALLEKGIGLKRVAISDALDQVAAFLGKAKEDGEVREDVDIDVASQAYMGMFQGLALLWLLMKQRFSIKMNATAMVDIFIRGIMK